MSPDVVGVTKDGKYVLGEAKGKDITHALEQFEHAGKQLGVPNIARQEIIATGLPPGYMVTDLGFLMTSDGVPVIVNCKPVRVTIVGTE